MLKNSSGRVRVAKKKFGSGRVAGTRQSLATTYSTNENPSTDKLNTYDNQLFFYQDKAGMTTPKSSLWFLVGRFEFGSIHETV